MPDPLKILRSASSHYGILTLHNTPQPPDVPHADPLTAVALSLTAALLHDLSPVDRAATALLLATHHGCLHIDREFDLSRREDPRFASPAAFARTLPSTLAAEIALVHQLTGPHITLLTPPATDPLPFLHTHAAAWFPACHLRYALTLFADLTPNTSPHVGIHLLAP